MRKIVKAALAIPEMQFAFECICADDNKQPEDYTDNAIVQEAEYRLSNYFEQGHHNNDMLLSDDGNESLETALQDVRMLKAFIKKYKTVDSKWSKYVNHMIK